MNQPPTLLQRMKSVVLPYDRNSQWDNLDRSAMSESYGRCNASLNQAIQEMNNQSMCLLDTRRIIYSKAHTGIGQSILISMFAPRPLPN